MPQTDTAGAMQLGEDLRTQVAEGLPAGNTELDGATISVGITMFGGQGEVAAEAVLVAADEAMYQAKKEGRNRITLFHDPGRERREGRTDADDEREDPRRAHPEPPAAWRRSRSAASPRAGSSATSCCCG